MKRSKILLSIILATLMLASLPISAAAPQQNPPSAAQQPESKTTTYTETEIIWSYSNETTITNNTPQSEVCEPEQTISAVQRSLMFPGTLADKNIIIYFIFKLNSTIMKSIKDFESAAAVGTPIYLGNFTLTLWFLGYKFNNIDYEEAEPYSSPLITFNTEDKIAAGELQYDMIYNGTEPILCYKYYGTLGELFKLPSQEQKLISATKLLILSCTHRKPFTKETTVFTLPSLAEMLLLDWSLNQEIVNYDYYYLATPERNIMDNTGDQTKHNWYAFNECRIPLGATTTISWSANNKEQQRAELSVAKLSSRVKKEVIGIWTNFYHDPAPFYFKIFQIYVPLGMKWIKVYTTIKAEAPASFPEDIWGMTDEGPLQESTKCAIEKAHWEYIPRDSSQMPYIRYRNYTMTSPSPGWYYFAVLTPYPNLEVKMNISFNCSQPLEKASYVQEALDMLSRDPAGARWYSQCVFKNTSFTLNTTVKQSKYTIWNNKTYDFYYFNSGNGTDNITYNGTDYTNGTWVPAEPSDINTAWLATNPDNPDGSNASVWFLKYSYTIYNRTVTTVEKTIKNRVFVYEYKYRALFDYTQKLNHPSELVEGVKTGRIQIGATKHSLMIPGFSLAQSFAELQKYNLNASCALAWIPPTFAHNATQGKYIKNAWVELIMFPTIRGTYFWTRTEANFKILYYYETMPPWALNTNYIIKSTSSCTQYFNAAPGTSSTHSFTGNDTGWVSFSRPCSFGPQSIFTVSAEIYKNGALYDTENVTTFWNCSYEIMPPQTNKAVLTLYLKEDMKTITNTYYKVYSITNASYQEKGYKDVPPGEPPSYPYFGFSIDTESKTGLPVSADVTEHIQTAGAAKNLTELANYYSNLTANVTNATLVNAGNTSYSFYMLSLERTYFA
ncbi:MAG: hypothetical protein QME47_07390, partial [Candidatus Thermoplasmatota archaeon]|nr:hypothetical protein [Candidatus Thermoplasmatota archaeon]